MYKFDLHVHTAETSRCGHVPAAEMAADYKRRGYDGIAVTDHLHETYISSLDCRDDWQQCVTAYLSGYRAARAAGDAIGLTVVLGVELRFPENDSDYLLYGVDEAFLRRNPYPHRTDHAAFFKKYGGELLIIQAHPYRNCDVVYDDAIHGLEVVNAHPRHDSRNELALALAERRPGLYRLCGSDAHQPPDAGRAAVLFEDGIWDSFAVKAAVEAGRYRLFCPDYADIIQRSGMAACTTR